MTTAQAILVLLAGVAAGTINTVVGSGTLLTFPTLLAVGYSPVTANVSNSVGLAPGALSGAYGYRRELKGQRERAIRLLTASISGGIIGAVLLLVLPASFFKAIVPAFIAVALLLIIFQKKLQAWVAARSFEAGRWTWPATFLAGIYGGYFGAAQGILLMAIFGLTVRDEMQRLNALKNLLAGMVNAVSGVLFIFTSHIAWAPALLLAGGSIVGGQLGAVFGRRLSPDFLRGLIVVVGLIAIVRLL
ncbi:MAG: uncharacterized protein QOF76_1308 [Solirubrobacteraceae bacterium]|nr:uncharacterized protein [Solirubrobacteraceae bacterium]